MSCENDFTGIIRTVDNGSESSGSKSVYSDPDGEANPSQTILVDGENAEHVMKKSKRLFNRKARNQILNQAGM